jgi:hypothetical protein
MPEQNVENCIRRLFENVWNRGQTELINEICSSNFICNFGTEAYRTRDQLRQDIAQWLEAFPDIQHEMVDAVVQNDKTRSVGKAGTRRNVHGYSCNG